MIPKRIKNKEYCREYRKRDYKKYMFQHCKGSAKHRNLDFNLTIDDIIIPKYCPYLGIEITQDVGTGNSYSNASIDRIDNSKGYIKGNIQIISFLANKMKQNVSIDQLIVFAENILSIHKLNKTA